MKTILQDINITPIFEFIYKGHAKNVSEPNINIIKLFKEFLSECNLVLPTEKSFFIKKMVMMANILSLTKCLTVSFGNV